MGKTKEEQIFKKILNFENKLVLWKLHCLKYETY